MEMSDTRPERDHIEMMRNPIAWPQWPVLPLINRSDDSTNLLQGRAGCMFASVENAVILRNMFAIPHNVPLTIVYQTDKAKGQAVDYPSAEAMYDAGWRVD